MGSDDEAAAWLEGYWKDKTPLENYEDLRRDLLGDEMMVKRPEGFENPIPVMVVPVYSCPECLSQYECSPMKNPDPLRFPLSREYLFSHPANDVTGLLCNQENSSFSEEMEAIDIPRRRLEIKNKEEKEVDGS